MSTRGREALTVMELKSLAAYARTGSTKEAAKSMGYAEQTLKNYCRGAYAKLGVHRAIDAFREIGWLEAPEI